MVRTKIISDFRVLHPSAFPTKKMGVGYGLLPHRKFKLPPRSHSVAAARGMPSQAPSGQATPRMPSASACNTLTRKRGRKVRAEVMKKAGSVGGGPSAGANKLPFKENNENVGNSGRNATENQGRPIDHDSSNHSKITLKRTSKTS